MKDRSGCVVLVPVGGYLEPECARGLADLESRGYHVRQVSGYSAIDQARSQIATDALAAGYDELMWIDSDIGFSADDVDRLREHDLPMVCGVYPKKGQRAMACHVLPGTRQVVLGIGGGLMELLYCATGFLHTRREVYEKIAVQEELPECNQGFGEYVVPYFLPMIVPHGDGHWYLGEDFAFCERARRSDFPVMADTAIRLYHHGRYGYSWEDAGNDNPRYDTYVFAVQS